MALVECVPNVSEGKRQEVVDQIAAAAGSVDGADLLDVHSDADHNRSVLTVVGTEEAVAESAFRIASAAVAAIDMRVHRGIHPRMGALDVLPFVPLGDTSMEACVRMAHQVGSRIADHLGVPVYFYGEAAMRPERRALANVRRGEFEGLVEQIGRDALRAPDVGPSEIGPAGATAVGARRPLVAFNMHIRTADLALVKAIARAVRASSGGLPGVQALAFRTSRPGIIQLSMNLFDLETTSVITVVERVRQEAELRGVELAESELVGLLPAQEIFRASSKALGLPAVRMGQVLELAAKWK